MRVTPSSTLKADGCLRIDYFAVQMLAQVFRQAEIAVSRVNLFVSMLRLIHSSRQRVHASFCAGDSAVVAVVALAVGAAEAVALTLGSAVAGLGTAVDGRVGTAGTRDPLASGAT